MDTFRAEFGPSSGMAPTESLRTQLDALASCSSLSDSEVELLQAVGDYFASRGDHQEALGFFILLSTVRPANPHYLATQAAIYRQLGRLKDALATYRRLDLLDPGKPEHTLSIAECLLGLKKVQEAVHLLEVLIDFCTGNEHQPAVLRKALALRDLVRGHHDRVH